MNRKLLLLGLLRNEGMYGYQLNEFIETSLTACVDIKKPTAYYLLNKMLEDGWVTQNEEQEGNRPPRRVYTLTDKGEAMFQELLRENLAHFEPSRFGNDIGLIFLDTLDKDEATQLLKTRRVALQNHLDAMKEVPTHPGSLQFMFQHQLHHLKAELSWLNEVIAQVEQV